MLVEADWVGVADVVRPMLCAMAAGGVFMRQGERCGMVIDRAAATGRAEGRRK